MTTKTTHNDVTAAALTLLLRSDIITQEELDTAQQGGYDGLFQLIGTKYAEVKEEESMNKDAAIEHTSRALRKQLNGYIDRQQFNWKDELRILSHLSKGLGERMGNYAVVIQLSPRRPE